MLIFPADTAKATTILSNRCFGDSMLQFAPQMAAREYPQFVDGLRQLNILNAALESHRMRGWVDVPARTLTELAVERNAC